MNNEGEKDKIESRPFRYHERVRNAYLEIAKRESAILIDGLKSREEIHKEIYKIAKEKIDQALKNK
jgi:thymidylate kinase